MYNIEYDVDINQHGRPSIVLSENHENKPEDKFLAIELTRYILGNIQDNLKDKYDENTINKLNDCLVFLTQISDEIAILLYNNMESAGELQMLMNNKYHVKVNSVKERDDLKLEKICYNGKIFKRVEGLKVFVEETNKIYQLIGGIDNENWK